MTRSHDDTRSLGRLEVLGAWLHLWTPHRDAVVPPVPRRPIALWAAGLLAALAVAAILIVPPLDAGKRRGVRTEARAAAARRAAERQRIEAEQVAHHGRGPATPGALLATGRAAVLADARARAARGRLRGPIRALTCAPAPGGRTRAYDCTAVTDYIRATKHNVAGALGYPFRLKLDVAAGRFAWCKQNPAAGEQAAPDPAEVVPLPRACRAD